MSSISNQSPRIQCKYPVDVVRSVVQFLPPESFKQAGTAIRPKKLRVVAHQEFLITLANLCARKGWKLEEVLAAGIPDEVCRLAFPYLLSGPSNTAFIWAADNNKPALMDRLPRANPAAENNKAIQCAAIGGHPNVVEYLLSRKDINKEEAGCLALAVAAESGRVPVVSRILRDKRIDVGQGKKYTVTCSPSEGLFDFAMEVVRNPQADHMSLLQADNYAMRQSCLNGHVAVVKLLLQDGRIDPTANGYVAFKKAAEKGHAGVICALLGDPRVKPDRRTLYEAILLACEKGHLGLVQMLFARPGADPNDVESLEVAASGGHLHIVKWRVAHKQFTSAEALNRALDGACNEGKLNVAQFLLKDNRIDPTYNESSCLFDAAACGQVPVVKALLRDRRALPVHGRHNALTAAIIHEHPAVVRCLLQDDRVDPSRDHNYAIQVASFFGNVDIVRLLLAHKRVDPSDQGNRALIKASGALFNRWAVMKLLLKDVRVWAKLPWFFWGTFRRAFRR